MDLTAEEFLRKLLLDNEEVSTTEIMIAFAKEHVRMALSSAQSEAIWQLDGRCWDGVYDKRFILKSYPEYRIK